MKSCESSGKTLDIAIENAVNVLNVNSRDELEISVLQESTKGFLGIGAKETKILATVKEKYEEVKEIVTEEVVKSDLVEDLAKEFLVDVITKMGVTEPVFEVNKEGQTLIINIIGNNTSLLIGKRGITLDAIQTLVNFAANKGIEDYVNIRLDTENYREARVKSLEKLANNLALKVKKTKRNATLEPMSSYERRIIHATLQNDEEVETYSEGQGAYRHVIIKHVK